MMNTYEEMSSNSCNPGLIVNGVGLNTFGMDVRNPYYPYDVGRLGSDQNFFQEQGQPNHEHNMDVWNPFYPYKDEPSHYVFEQQPALQCNLTRFPSVYSVDELSLPNSEQSTYMEAGRKMNFHVMNSRYHEAMDTSEEKFKKTLYQFEELIRHEIKDCQFNYEMSQPVQLLPFSEAFEVTLISPPGCDVSNSLCPTIKDFTGYGTLVDNSRNSNSYSDVKSYHNVSNFFSRSSFGDDIRMCPSVSCHGNNLCTNETVRQGPFEVVPSPDPISSVTACSDSERQADNEPIDAGAAIMDNAWQYPLEVSSQDYINGSKPIEQEVLFDDQSGYYADHSLGLEGNIEEPYIKLSSSNQLMGRLSSECKVYPSVFVNKTTSGSEEVPYPQIQFSVPRHRYRPPINLLGHHSDVQSQSCLAAPVQLSKLIDSRNVSSQDILLQYKEYKSVKVNVGEFQIPLLSYLHCRNCTINRCQCKQFELLISHFDNCNDSSCNMCYPPLLGGSNYNVRSASDISNNSFSNVYGDELPPAKRTRVENLLTTYIKKETAPVCLVAEKQEMKKKNEKFYLVDSRRDGVHQDVATNNNQQLGNFNSPNIAEDVNQSYKMLKVEHICTSEIKSSTTTDNIKVSPENLIMGLESEKKDVLSSGDTKSEATSCLIEHTDNNGLLNELQESRKVGVSLIDILTANQIEEHTHSLGKVTNEMSTDDTLVHGLGESLCQLCAMDKLLFNPAPIYCICCGSPIKRNLIYYWTPDKMGGKHCFCGQCFRKSSKKSISVQGLSFCKSNLHKGKNIVEEDEESWVQCDKCERWQHQICALYNSKNDSEGKAKYVCPSCRLHEIKIGEHRPLCPPFGAKDLPCTKLSDHIEQRLHRRLKEERQERGMSAGKSVDEVPQAENLVVRVVLSVNKLVKVKQQFLDIFHGKNYPAEFSYKSKAILLFQKIKGVDVCLFGMYVQEYGSDCPPPNRRAVYISYLDSVKYFQPEIRTVHGEALRTFVYHEILIGYLDYCKKLGFETCYIWACPPVKGEDYILNCHPEIQKTPKSDKLRHWYKSMLLKATKENVVSDSTNFYDRFFVPNAQCSPKVTTANLPYFDGAYWSGAAEDLNRRICMEGGSKEIAKKQMSKRTLKSMGHTNLSVDSETDILVMQKLGQVISPVKEDFIIVDLQPGCSSCHKLILSPNYWLCAKCKNFRVCLRCIKLERGFSKKTHFIDGEQHTLSEIVMYDVPQNTDDEDGVLDNDIFENRHSFLSFCQENHFQFDSLRRAKYSSMMILYHLHKQISSGLVTDCSICRKGTMINDGWRCEVCPGITVCRACYQREGNHAHVHELTQRLCMTECCSNNKQLQKQKAASVKEEILKTLVHAFRCQHSKEDPCSYSKCPRLKELFHHASQCLRRVDGGCEFCRIAWTLLHLHSRICKITDCQVPHCQSIKTSRNLKATQADNRRRAAIEGSVSNIGRQC
ncbi:hypothetical protein Leryth_005872 [Lithospermum erythrorhizon]|nr:hypothetical protein Leryth_005872 [Lithospermum erythrorhizon]